MPPFCQYFSILNGKSADLLFPSAYTMVSQYLLYSILKNGQQRLWLVSSPWCLCQGIVSDDKLGFTLVSLETVLTCIVKFGKCVRPCVVSTTTLLFLIKCYAIIDPVDFFITTKCLTNILSPISNVSVVLPTVFLTGYLLLVFENWEDRQFSELFWGLPALWCPRHSRRLHWRRLLNLPKHLLLEKFWNSEVHTTFPVCGLGLQ